MSRQLVATPNRPRDPRGVLLKVEAALASEPRGTVRAKHLRNQRDHCIRAIGRLQEVPREYRGLALLMFDDGHHAGEHGVAAKIEKLRPTIERGLKEKADKTSAQSKSARLRKMRRNALYLAIRSENDRLIAEGVQHLKTRVLSIREKVKTWDRRKPGLSTVYRALQSTSE